MSAWKPISTAPFETRILGYWQEYHHIEDVSIYKDGPDDLFCERYYDDCEYIGFPSHWMPLPEPPK